MVPFKDDHLGICLSFVQFIHCLPFSLLLPSFELVILIILFNLLYWIISYTPPPFFSFGAYPSVYSIGL